MTIYDQARTNDNYWQQWRKNFNNLAIQGCQICKMPLALWPIHLRDQPLCLDCHGPLAQLWPYVYRCERCHVLHGFSGGNSSPYARFHRSGLLTIIRGGKEIDLSPNCKLSRYPPFLRWLSRRRSC